MYDRTDAGSPELLALSLSAIGRGGALAPAPVADGVTARENRVEIRRAGLVEWYVNSASGLEQGFTLERRPPGIGPIVLELNVDGGRAVKSRESVWFETAAHRKLHYGELRAYDASGRELVAHLEVPAAQRLRIAVNDAGAAYPIAIDPLLTAADAQLHSNQPHSGFGTSVAGAGDVNGDGYADVIVGAPYYDPGDLGAAFVFLGGPAGIHLDPATQLTGNDFSGGLSDPAAAFGASTAGAGDVNGDGFDDVLVGATDVNNPPPDHSAVFLFLGSASGIASGNANTASAKFTTDAGSLFGGAVAGAGDVNRDGYADVILGAPGYAGNQGAAFLFLGSASGISGGSAYSVANTRFTSGGTPQVGWSVAGAGDVNGDGYDDVIVSGPAALVFLGRRKGILDGTPATAATRLQSDQADARLTNVAGAGDVDGDGYDDVIVSAPVYDAGQTDEGAAFVFRGSAAGIPDQDVTTAATRIESNQAQADLGVVAGAGDVNGDGYGDVLVGSGHYPYASAFEFHGGASGIASGSTAIADRAFTTDQPTSAFASSLAGAGDLDGDGVDDVIIGAPYYDITQPQAGDDGAAFVYMPEPARALELAGGSAVLFVLARRRRVHHHC